MLAKCETSTSTVWHLCVFPMERREQEKENESGKERERKKSTVEQEKKKQSKQFRSENHKLVSPSLRIEYTEKFIVLNLFIERELECLSHLSNFKKM